MCSAYLKIIEHRPLCQWEMCNSAPTVTLYDGDRDTAVAVFCDAHGGRAMSKYNAAGDAVRFANLITTNPVRRREVPA